MKSLPLALSFVALTLLSGCDLVGDVVEFGFWTGIVAVAVVAGLIWFAVKAFKK